MCAIVIIVAWETIKKTVFVELVLQVRFQKLTVVVYVKTVENCQIVKGTQRRFSLKCF